MLDAALEVEPGEWPAVLDRLCTGDPALRREAESLLARHTRARGFLEAPVAGIDDLDAAATAGRSSLAGRRLGAYRVVTEIARGGMGRVLLAERADGEFEQRVAIKLLLAGLETEEAIRRFRAERQILASLSHPSIARLIDGGVTDEGWPFLVMEFVEGEPIHRHCDANRLSIRDSLRLFLKVTDAVQYAHRNLIVHRDLKPSNIHITPDGEVKLLDFGIAKLLDEEALPEAAPRTLMGRRWMTPEYAAPEQIRGELVTTATDIYQLGVVLYELLAGRRPFERNGGSLHDLEQAVLTREPEKPSTVVTPGNGGPSSRRQRSHVRLGTGGAHGARTDSARAQRDRALHDKQLHRILRGDLDAIVLKALRKEPHARYASVGDLARDIEHYSKGLPVAARRGTTGYRARKFVRRHRWGVAMALALVLLLAGYAATVTVQDARVRQALAQARVQRDAAIHERQRAEAQIEFQNVLMSQMSDRPMTMREMADRGREALERQYAGDPRFLGEMLLQLSQRYADLGDGIERGRLLARAESLAVAGGADGVAEVRCYLADHLRTEGRYDEAWKVLNGADSIRAQRSDANVHETCLQMRAYLAYETGKAAESKDAILEVLAIKEARRHVRDTSYFEALGALGVALEAEGSFRDALEAYRRAGAGMDSSGRAETLTRSTIQHNLALTLVKLGETAEAERLLHEVLQRMARSDPSGFIHPQPLIHYAETALTQGHADSAAKYFDQLLAQAVRDTSRYWQGRGSFGLARAQARLGRLEEARRTAATFRLVSAGFPGLRSTDDQLPDTMALDGWIALAAGDTGAAHEHFMASLRSNQYFEGKKKNQQAAVVLQAAESALWLGHADSALALSSQVRAIASRDSLTETRSAFVGEARLVEGRALLAIGDTLQALSAVEAALIALRNGAGDAHRRTREAETLLLALRASPAVAGRR